MSLGDYDGANLFSMDEQELRCEAARLRSELDTLRPLRGEVRRLKEERADMANEIERLKAGIERSDSEVGGLAVRTDYRFVCVIDDPSGFAFGFGDGRVEAFNHAERCFSLTFDREPSRKGTATFVAREERPGEIKRELARHCPCAGCVRDRKGPGAALAN